jgi:hypothetical protein
LSAPHRPPGFRTTDSDIISKIYGIVFIYHHRQELDICDQESSSGSDSVIYKQVGPVLIKNDLDEARDTVEKRLEFITAEM